LNSVDLVLKTLKAVKPANVDLTEVTVSGEGSAVGIVLIPHHDLGGLSLVAWCEAADVTLLWAGVTDLGRHDQIDLGQRAARLSGADCTEGAIRAALDREFGRPIRTRLKRTRLLRLWQLRCEVELDDRRADLFVSNVGRPPVEGGGLVDCGETSLAGPARPAGHWPVPIERWRQFAQSPPPHSGGGPGWGPT